MMPHTLRAEWIKLRSLRSTWLTLAVSLGSILMAAGLSLMANGMYDAAPASRRDAAQLTELEDVVIIVPQLCLGILGVLAAVKDIPASYIAVPRRWPVLAGKAVGIAACGLIVGQVTMFGSALVTRLVVGERFHLEPLADRVPLLVVSGLSVVVLGLLGLGLGTLLRSVAACVALLAGVLYVFPIISFNLPGVMGEWGRSIMIGGLPRLAVGADLTNTVYGTRLSATGAAAVLAAYAVVPLAAGVWALRRRDL
ncbi:hypothetical protein ACIBH1_04595 [Nonomuraea sp. NPDC050663]|uniref:hypothetical protein n=1 Tax=Nonomuraea sp. NPDC050663 TaxID=3364370 RepID=UPI0037B7162E